MTAELPKIISVDDHVVEPPDLWTSRLPAKYSDRWPRVERDRAKFHMSGGEFSFEKGVPDGDVGRLVALRRPRLPVPQAVGRESASPTSTTSRSRSTRSARAAGSRRNDSRTWTPTTSRRRSASRTCCPGSAARRSSSVQDKELALLCVQAYNDWMIDEWCAGDGEGRLIPLTIVPLWDRSSPPPRSGAAPTRAATRSRSPRTRSTSACRRCTTRTASGTRCSPRAKRPNGGQHAHRLVVEDAVDVARLAVHRELDRSRSRTRWAR